MENKNKIVLISIVVVLIAGLIGGFIYWKISSEKIYIEKAKIYAPTISLYPRVGGVLYEVFVNEGDYVKRNDPVARVGNELIKANSDGLILTAGSNIGSVYAPTSAVATMIDPNELRIIGEIQEDKGLKYLVIGQRAMFTVDAFGSKEYSGLVDEISPVSNEGDIVFNISDQREEKTFNVKVRFNVAAYSELKNGMSAKLWIYK